MKIGFSTIAVEDKALIENIPFLAETGFELLEIRAKKGHFDYESAQDIALLSQRLKRDGLKVYSMHMPSQGYSIDPAGKVEISHLDEWWRVWSLREIEKAILALHRLEGEMFVLHLGSEVKDTQRKARLAQAVESMKELVDFSSQWGIRLAIENTLPGRVGDKIEDILWILERIKAPTLGICLDTGHINMTGGLQSALGKIGGYLFHLHIHDNWGKGEDEHLLPGKGNIDWIEVMRRLEEMDYKGVLMLETKEIVSADSVRYCLSAGIV